MQIGVPTQLAPVLFAKALSRLFLVYSAYSVIFAEILIILAGAHSMNWAVMGAGFLVGFPGFVLWWLMYSPLSPFSASLYIVFLSITIVIASWTVLATMAEVESTKFLPFTLLGFALITTCGVAARARDRVLWATLGLAAANMSLAVGAGLANSSFEFDWRLLLAYAIVVVAVVATPNLIRANTRIQVNLENSTTLAEKDTELVVAARNTAATLHDTVLANLAVISAAKTGTLQDNLRSEIESVLLTIHSESPATSRAISNEIVVVQKVVDVIAQAEAAGLEVNLSGDMGILEDLDPFALDAVSGALGQCLTNVLQHSGQKSVEVVILKAGSTITLTIIDGGKGFVPENVPSDRLGIKLSVTERIEAIGGSVKIWSDIGRGAAVMLQIPAGGVC